MRCHKIGLFNNYDVNSMKILWCSVIRYLFTNEAELINQTGRQLSHSRWIFFPSLRFSHFFCTYCQPPIFFLSLLQITNDVFLLTSKYGCRSRMYEESSAKCWHFTETEKNCCLVDAAFSTGCDEKSFVSIFGESAAEPPQPLPAAAASTRRRRADVHRGCFFLEEGWLTAPCIAHHHTRTVRR